MGKAKAALRKKSQLRPPQDQALYSLRYADLGSNNIFARSNQLWGLATIASYNCYNCSYARLVLGQLEFGA